MTTPRSAQRSEIMSVGAALVTLAAMIATPLCPARSRARRRLAGVVVGGLTMLTASSASRRWGARRVAATAAGVTAATLACEVVGTTRGMPFGRYHYTDRLRPQIAGVPVIVPAAWFAMAIPAREAAHCALGDRSTPARRVALGAAALTAWDLFLDPQMTSEGYWRWHRPGRYRGIPLTNYLGWLVIGAAVMAALERTLPPGDPADPALVAEYAVMGAMETVGFAQFFGDRLVALVGGLGMGSIAGVAVGNLIRRSFAPGTCRPGGPGGA